MDKRLLANLWVVPAAATLLAVISEYSGLDVWLVRPFYDVDAALWPLRSHWLTETVLHKGGRNLVLAIGALFLSLFLASWIWSRMKRWRRDLAYILVAALSAIALVAGLKSVTHIYSPWDLQMFGGEMAYVRIFDSVAAQASRGHAFPAGHASGGYAFFSIFFAMRQNRIPHYRLSLLLPFLLGGLFGAAQQVRGAHFLSHDLLTLAICWLSAAVWQQVFYNVKVHDFSRAGLPGRELAERS